MSWRILLASTVFLSVQSFAGEVHLRTGSVELNFENMQALSRTTSEADYIIQFNSPIGINDQALLKSNHIKVLRYIPDNAYLVRAKASTIRMALEGRLSGVALFEKSWKMSPDIMQALAAAPFQSWGTQQAEHSFDLMAFNEADAKHIEKALHARKIETVRDERMLRFKAPLTEIAKIAELTGIENLEETPQVKMMNFDLSSEDLNAQASGDYSDLNGYESGTKVMHFETAWNKGYFGTGQIAASGDTGLDMGSVSALSSDFQGAVTEGFVVGIGAKDWSDPMGHGTHVAGSIVGRGTASKGILQGGAHGATFFPEGMWSPLIDNLTVPPKLNKLFDPAYTYGARIHSNSWGAPAHLGDYDSMASQVDEFMYNHPDFLVVIAAGNSGIDKDKNGVIDPNSISSPGTSKNSLTVGASENLVTNGGIQKTVSEIKIAKDDWPAEPIWSSKLSDNADGIACFSSRGPTADGRLKPEIVAPGTNILSTRSHVSTAEVLWGAYNDDYVWSGGTSMATPLTAGAAVVTREIIEKVYNVKNPSAALVKAMMINAAKDLYPGQYGEGSATQELQHRPEPNQGYGRVDMQSVVEANRPLVIDETRGVATSQKKEYTVQVQEGQGIIVNMVYTDAPGTPSAGKALVNDLDLEVVGPNGTLAPHDRINNHEIVESDNLPAGTYTIRVVGANVPMGQAQPFALVATVQ